MASLYMHNLEKKYNETLEYMFAKLPMFTRVGTSAYKKNLDNIIALNKYENNPHLKYQTIHIGGTNGKGSCTHLLASILQEKGLKTGVYVSPHYVDFRERIKINGNYISKDLVIEYIEKNKKIIEDIQPSFFEITAAMAFWYFALQEVDIAVIEVGLGGRLDSTNIIQPKLSLITHIAFDHVNVLGNSLQEIANEKAGIIKSKTPIVIGKYQEALADIFINKAHENDSDIYFADKQFEVNCIKETLEMQTFKVLKNGVVIFEKLECPLLGNYQKSNIQSVLQCVEILNNNGFEISKSNIENGIKKVKKNTKIIGRYDIMQQNPLVVCDSAHNEDGIKAVIQQIQSLKCEKIHIVWGNVNDKDISKMMKLLPRQAAYYFCTPNIPRGLPINNLIEIARLYSLQGKTYKSVKLAVTAALNEASKNDVIFIGGSTFVVAEVFAENIFN
jgi:dihydrofolate synthase/folylpolyglutamate synthase